MKLNDVLPVDSIFIHLKSGKKFKVIKVKDRTLCHNDNDYCAFYKPERSCKIYSCLSLRKDGIGVIFIEVA